MKTKVRVESIPLGYLRPMPNHGRKELQHSEEELYQQILCSLHTFGLVEPLVWNQRTQHLISGHQRYQVLKDQEVNSVDCSIVQLTREEEQRLSLALNKIRGTWHLPRLRKILQSLVYRHLSHTGFSTDEVIDLFVCNEQSKVSDHAYEPLCVICPRCGHTVDI